MQQIKKGDIVSFTSSSPYPELARLFFYVDAEEFGGNPNKVGILLITGWVSWNLGVDPEHLEVVGHIDPFETNLGEKILEEKNFLPIDKKPLLAAWIKRRT